MKSPRETDLVKQLLRWLDLRGIVAWRQNQGAMAGEHKGKRRFLRFAGIDGISDIMGLIPPAGRLLACEAKMPGNAPTPKQEAFLALVRQAGGVAVVAYSIEDLERGLRAAGGIP